MTAEPPTPTRWHGAGPWIGAACELLALSGLAVAQPVFDVLARHTTFLVAHRADPATIVWLAVAVSLFLPLALVVLELALAPLSRLQRTVHATIVVLLVALILLTPLNRAFPAAPPLLAIAAVVGFGVAFDALRRARAGVRRFLVLLSPAGVVFPLAFLLFSPVSSLVFPKKAGHFSPENGRAIPIVLVVFDELALHSLLDANGAIDSRRFPNFARMATSSWWFPRAIATSPSTERAIPAILTGRNLPSDKDAAPVAQNYPNNLLSWLGSKRAVQAHEMVTAMCPPAVCRAVVADPDSLTSDLAIVFAHLVTPPRWRDRWLPSLEGTWTGFSSRAPEADLPADRDAWRAAAFGPRRWRDRRRDFENIVDAVHSPNSLTFIHALLPHIPYEYLSSGNRYSLIGADKTLPRGVANDTWTTVMQPVREAYLRYLLQLAFTDKLLGRLMDTLQARGLWDDALIIVTADHGVSIAQGAPRRTLRPSIAPAIARVPTFVKLPQQHEAVVSQRVVSGIDVLPTIAEVIGITPPWSTEGASMVAAAFPDSRPLRIDRLELTADEVFGGTPPSWQQELAWSDVPTAWLTVPGPLGEQILGRKPTELPIAPGPSGTFHSPSSFLLSGIDQHAEILAVTLEGTIESPPGSRDGDVIAVAINDTIRATTDTFSWSGASRFFSVQLPEAAFDRADNRVSLYLATAGHEGLMLRAMRWLESRPLRIAPATAGSEAIVPPAGREIPVLSSAGFDFRYSLDRAYSQGDVAGLVGWAGDITNSRAPEQFAIFVDGQSLFAGPPDLERPDVVQVYGAAFLRSGFGPHLSRSALLAAAERDPGLATLRVFAIFSEGAREIVLSEKARTEFALQLKRSAQGS